MWRFLKSGVPDKKAGGSSSSNNQTDNNMDVCPVCLRDDVSFVQGPCQHNICLPCVERILAAPIRRGARDSNSSDGDDVLLPAEDAHLDVPTRGRCPMCRCEICLFDLVKVVSVDENDDSPLPAAVNKNPDITVLKGRTYVRNRSQIGNQSLHFPSCGDDDDNENTADEDQEGKQHDDDDDNNELLLPYMDFSKVEGLTFDNGDPIPERKYFEPDFHFHESTRTFHGRLKWGDSCSHRVKGSLEWELVVAFSSDFQFISRGVLAYKRNTCQDYTTCSTLHCKFPLDGRWSVSDSLDDIKKWPPTIVHNNKLIARSLSNNANEEDQLIFLIDYQQNKYPICTQSNMVCLESQHNLAKRNVKVGKTLEFNKGETVWTRDTCQPEREDLKVLNFGSGPSQLCYYALSDDAMDSAVPEYHSDSVWGNTFCQGFTVGLASYHFMETMEDGAYISYEHEGASMWPPLDNGNPIPSRIWFTDISFDPESRIFRGNIDWEGTHQTTWQGSRWWRYEMQFDESYSCITGGYVNSVQSGSEDEMDMSKFGFELVYINVGLVEECKSSGDFDVIQRTIDMLSNDSSSTAQQTSTFNLMVMLRTAMRENRTIGYPRSFRRSEEASVP